MTLSSSEQIKQLTNRVTHATETQPNIIVQYNQRYQGYDRYSEYELAVLYLISIIAN